MFYFFALLFISFSLKAMDDYRLEGNLTLYQLGQTVHAMQVVKEWKASKAKLSDWNVEHKKEVQPWVNAVLDKQVSPTQLRAGETILTQLMQTSAFGDLDFYTARLMTRVVNAGANVNQRNYNGLTPLTIAVKNGRKMAIDDLVRNRADLNTSVQDYNPNNLIRAGFIALEQVKNPPASFVQAYQRKDCEMMMAYILDRVAPSTITKSQVHAAWKLGFKDLSRALACCKKYPENRDAIVTEFKRNICARLVQEFKRVARYS